MSCPARPCAAGPFSDAQVAAMTSSEVFSTYIESRTKLAETRLVQELTEQKNQELRRELSRLSSLNERQRRVEAAVMRVQEVLTDKCPRCEAAFLDYANCSALTCHRCGCRFCAWCLRDCGADAHQHVANCPLNMTPGRQVYAEAVRPGCGKAVGSSASGKLCGTFFRSSCRGSRKPSESSGSTTCSDGSVVRAGSSCFTMHTDLVLIY